MFCTSIFLRPQVADRKAPPATTTCYSETRLPNHRDDFILTMMEILYHAAMRCLLSPSLSRRRRAARSSTA